MTNKDLVKKMKDEGILKTPLLINAFLEVDRIDFVQDDYESKAYVDNALPIGYGQTISQPSTVAFMLELLSPTLGDKVLDIGSGSGWTTALLAEAVGPEGRVVGVERIPELAKFGANNIAKYDYKNVRIIESGIALGLPEDAPYNKILVSAAAENVPPELVSQLKVSGILVIPIINSIYKITKITEDEVKTEEFTGFAFVPLIRESHK